MTRIYKNKRDNCWWVDYVREGKRTRRKVGPSRDQAQWILNKILVDKANREYLGIKKIDFSEFAAKYLDNTMSDNKPSTVRRKKISVRHLIAHFSGKNLDEVTPLAIEEYKRARLAAGTKNGTFNRERACLHHIFRKAMDWEYAQTNPVAKVRPLVENNEIVRYLSEGEYSALMDAAPSWLKDIIVTAIVTLLRKSEIQNLKWTDIDLKQRLMRVVNPKSNRDQYVAISPSLSDRLGRLKINSASDYVFPGRDGGRNNNIDKPFKKALQKAGIKDFRFHDLRHTGASYLAMAGIGLKEIQSCLRHKYISTTMRYVHLIPRNNGSHNDPLAGFVAGAR